MDDRAELERLLAEGYLVIGAPVHVSQMTGWSLNAYPNGFDWRKYRRDPAIQDKSLVMFFHPFHPVSGQWVEMLTLDEEVLTRVRDQFNHQQEVVGTLIEVTCAARRGGQYDQWQLHLDNFAESLQGFAGWEFSAPDDVGTMKVKMRMEPPSQVAVRHPVQMLERLLDVLAVSNDIGFRIIHVNQVPIRRQPLLPEVGIPWPMERMIDRVKMEQAEIAQKDVWPQDVWGLARTLREVYLESLPAAQLTKLCAAVERVLGGEPEHLLNTSEKTELIESAKTIESLKGDLRKNRAGKDIPWRLDKAISILSDPKKFPRYGIDERLAQRIAPILGIQYEDAKKRVDNAWSLRGGYAHEHRYASGEAKGSIDFLISVVKGYIEVQTKS